ncbi:hypothetical protein LQZ18_07595 [Lachnospiraceae bacterium ZAX-1]
MIGSISNELSPYSNYSSPYGNSNNSPYSNYGTNSNKDSDTPSLQGLKDADAKKTNGVSAPEECQTCKNRVYVDGSNENVSFKSPTRVSPEAAAAKVQAHEGEHVANAYAKAAQDGGKVIRASVSIKTAICPECGTTYVSGGTTTTSIKYPGKKVEVKFDQKTGNPLSSKEVKFDQKTENSAKQDVKFKQPENPYDKNRRVLAAEFSKGQRIDYVA